MKSFFLLTGAVISLNIGLAHGAEIPSDVMRGHILPRLENSELSNYGATDKANAQMVEAYKQDDKIRPKAKFSLPSVQKVLEALTAMPNPDAKTITIGNVEWKIMAKTRDFHSDAMKALRLDIISVKVVQGQEKIEGTYFYSVQGFINLERSLQPSQSTIKMETCAITNPGSNKILIKNRDYVYQKGLDFPPDQDLNILCDQVPKEE